MQHESVAREDRSDPLEQQPKDVPQVRPVRGIGGAGVRKGQHLFQRIDYGNDISGVVVEIEHKQGNRGTGSDRKQGRQGFRRADAPDPRIGDHASDD